MVDNIIISMTSWKGRIKNVTRTLDTIWNNTVKPRIINLNLSEEEFPQKEAELPAELLEWQEKHIHKAGHKVLEIHWVGPNTKSFKKLIPTVRRYFSNDVVIITIDDDVLYENDFIEKFVKAAEEHPDTVISNNMCRGCWFNQQCVNGAATLYRPKFFNAFLWEGLIQVVVDTNEDDWWYSFNLWLFGSRQVIYIPTKLVFFNEVAEHQYEQKNTQQVLMNYWRWLINRKEVVELSPIKDDPFDTEYAQFIEQVKNKHKENT